MMPRKSSIVVHKPGVVTNILLPPPTFNIGNLTSPPPWYLQQLEGSEDLVHWKEINYLVSNPLVEVRYMSNTITHSVTPVETNYYTNAWIVTNKDVHFFRLKGNVLRSPWP